MTIFDHLNILLFTKKKIELNCDDESQFSLFMVNRWGSFYSKEIANYINETSNRYGYIYTDKTDQFNFLYHVLPRIKLKKINYIKKIKQDKAEDIVIIPEFMSMKEFKNNVEFIESISK